MTSQPIIAEVRKIREAQVERFEKLKREKRFATPAEHREHSKGYRHRRSRYSQLRYRHTLTFGVIDPVIPISPSIQAPKKLGSNLGPISAENQVKPWYETQSQAKRINKIVLLWLLRDQLLRPHFQ